MSSSKLIDSGQLSAYERWELPSMDKKPEPSPVGKQVVEKIEDVEKVAVKLPTAEDLEQIRSAAQQEGYETGRKEGLAAAEKQIQAELQTSRSTLQNVINSLTKPLDDVDAAVEQELVALAFAIARQIIRRELKTSPGEVVAVVREALGALPAAVRKVTIYLHPDDAVLVREALNAGSEEFSWRLHEDARMTRGGCQIQTEHSQIDATVEKRLAAIASRVLGGERADDGLSDDDHESHSNEAEDDVTQ